MEPLDVIADGLPAPRDDEPATLRQDILDELNDHLQSALARELRTVPDEAAARRNVLTRFGDPRRIMYQLWFQAMKEKIMSQRVMLVLCAVMVVACLAALGMTWSLVQQNGATQAALLDKITALVPQGSGAQGSAEWSPVKIRLAYDEAGQHPARDFSVSLLGELLQAKNTALNVYTDATGLADFGSIRAGQFRLTLSSPSGDQLETSILVRRGQAFDQLVICPQPREPGLAKTSFNLAWPEDLRDKGLWTVLQLYPEQQRVASEVWQLPPTTVFLDAQGRIVRHDDSNLEVKSRAAKSSSGPAKFDYYLSDVRPDYQSSADVGLYPVRYALGSLLVVMPGQPNSPLLGRSAPGTTFQPTTTQPNQWTIQLPDDLVAQVRKELAQPAVPAAADKPPQASSQNPDPSQWRPVKFQLVLDDGHDTSADDYKLYVKGRLFGDTETQFEFQNDGVSDLGLIHVGTHQWTVESPFGEKAVEDFFVRPASVDPAKKSADMLSNFTFEKEGVIKIRCPVPPEEADVAFDIPWPDDLRDKGLWAVCYLAAEPRKTTDPRNWNGTRPSRGWSPITYIAVLNPQGKFVRFASDDGLTRRLLRYGIGESGKSYLEGANQNAFHPPAPTKQDERDVIAELFRGTSSEPQPTTKLAAVKYTVKAVAVFKPVEDKSWQAQRDGATMLGVLPYGNYGQLEPVAKQENRFAIPLPDDLLQQVRKQLSQLADGR